MEEVKGKDQGEVGGKDRNRKRESLGHLTEEVFSLTM